MTFEAFFKVPSTFDFEISDRYANNLDEQFCRCEMSFLPLRFIKLYSEKLQMRE